MPATDLLVQPKQTPRGSYVPTLEGLEERCVLSPFAFPAPLAAASHLAAHGLVRSGDAVGLVEAHLPALASNFLGIAAANHLQNPDASKLAQDLILARDDRLERPPDREDREARWDQHLASDDTHAQSTHLAVDLHAGLESNDDWPLDSSETGDQDSVPAVLMGTSPAAQKNSFRFEITLKGAFVDASLMDQLLHADGDGVPAQAALDFVFGNPHGVFPNGTTSLYEDSVALSEFPALVPQVGGLIQEAALIGFNEIEAGLRSLLDGLKSGAAALAQVSEAELNPWLMGAVVSAAAVELARRQLRQTPGELPALGLPTMRSSGFHRRSLRERS